MKVNLRAGASIDVLSPDEYEHGVSKLHAELARIDTKDYFQQAFQIPAGSYSQVVYECPLGSMVQIHRLTVNAPGYSASNPLTSGNVEFLLNSDMIQFLPVDSIVAPVVMTEGTGGIVLHGGETIGVNVDSLETDLSLFIQFRRWGME